MVTSVALNSEDRSIISMFLNLNIEFQLLFSYLISNFSPLYYLLNAIASIEFWVTDMKTDSSID